MFTRVWMLDTLERLVRTFLQAFLAVLVAAGPVDLFSLSTVKAAGVAGLAAVFALFSALVGGVNHKPGAGLVVASVPNETVPSREVPPAVVGDRGQSLLYIIVVVILVVLALFGLWVLFGRDDADALASVTWRSVTWR